MTQIKTALKIAFFCLTFTPLTVFPQTSVPCGANDLISAIETAVNSGTPQTLSLAPACTYSLTAEKSGDAAGPNGLPLITGANITIIGNGATIERAAGSPAFRLIQVSSTGVLDISNVTLRGGLTRTSTIRSQGDGEYGGAILSSGITTITDATITDNKCGNGFPGSDTETETDGGGGAGLANSGTMTVKRSTIVNNTTGNGGGQDGAPGHGGGIDNAGGLTVVNSTICNNSVGTGFVTASGAGIYSGFQSNLTIKNSTICSNTDTSQGGGVTIETGNVVFSNNILSGNSPLNCSKVFSDGGHNLDSGESCNFSTANGSLNNTDAKLEALANHGGKTFTAKLPDNSPAIDAGDNSVCADADVASQDQRALPRPAGAVCDIGAYEAGAGADCSKKPSKPVLISPAKGFSTTEKKLTLAWDSVECATSYKVSLTNGGNVIQNKTVKNKTSLTTKALAPKSYSWSVEACNKKGCAKSKKFKFSVKKK